MIFEPSEGHSPISPQTTTHVACSFCSQITPPNSEPEIGSACEGPIALKERKSGKPKHFEGEIQLVGYDTICLMLAVDGKPLSRRTAMRYLRRHRDIAKPIKIGSQICYPSEQIFKLAARIRGKGRRREIFL